MDVEHTDAFVHEREHFGTKPHPRVAGVMVAYCLAVPGCAECETSVMVEEIAAVWQDPHTPNALLELIYDEQDGYGIVGYIPSQGYDWSGIRDSTPEAVRRMYALIHA